MNASQVADIRALEADASYNSYNKAAFHKVARKLLRRLAKALNVSAPIHSNQGGMAVSGEITLHADHVHAWIEQWRTPILIYRACQSTKDYTGSTNHISMQLIWSRASMKWFRTYAKWWSVNILRRGAEDGKLATD